MSSTKRPGSSARFRQNLVSGAVALGVLTPLAAIAAEGETTTLSTVKVEAKQEDGIKAEKAASPKYTEPLRDTPKSITVVTKDAMDMRGATTLEQALRNVSGITMSVGEGGTPSGDNLSIRGFSARTDMFVDGMRDFGGYFRDPFNLEAVEVAKGPSSAYSGRGGTGGTINQVSKTAKLDPFTAGSASVGTDNLERLTLDVNRPLSDTSAFRLNVMGHNSDAPGRDVVENNRWGVAPSLAFGLDTDTRVTISLFHLTEDNIPDYGHPYSNVADADGVRRPVKVDRDTWYGLKSRDFEDLDTNLATVALEHDVNADIRLKNQTRYGESERESVVTAPRLQAPYTAITREGKNRNSLDRILANQTDLTLSFTTGAIRHDLVTGIELSNETSNNAPKTYTNMVGADIENPNPNDAYTGTISVGTRSEAKSRTRAFYVFDTAHLNPQWDLNLGVRYDDLDTDYQSLTNAGVATKLSSHDEFSNWQAAVVYKPADNGSVYASYSSSVNPSSENLSLSTTTVNLDPEETRSYELGTKWDVFDERLALTAAVFRIEKTNARTSDGTSGSVTVLEGEQRADGFEIGATGNITENWQVIASYTYLDTEITESRNPAEIGNELSNAAPHSYSLWTTYKPMPKLIVGAGMQYVDKRYGNTTNTVAVADYTLYDAMASYELNRNVTLRLNLSNLTDEEYYERMYGGHAVPGAGRLTMLTADFRF